MGQYFKAVNLDKREYVCPWCVGGVAKLWEWAANPWGAIFVMLLRKSSETGGGDYGSKPTVISLDDNTDSATLTDIIQESAAHEGQPFTVPLHTTVGRWAGDRVALIGDYDESKLWDELPSYANISADVVRDWNDFIEIKEYQLAHNPRCTCSQA